MDKFLSKLARKLTPYIPGEQLKVDNLIKLNTNENPYPPSVKVLSAMKKAVTGKLRLYPSPECEELRDTIAIEEGLPNREYVYVGNGSDEILEFCFAAFFDGEQPVLFPDITYSFYPVYCNLLNLTSKEIPLDEKLNINVDDYTTINSGIIFPNPNAPTGVYLTIDKIISLLNRNTETVVVIDEAYIDFGGQSAAHLIVKYPNLVVTRTVSKSHSLAGLRGGYVMAQPNLIDGVKRVKNSFNSYTMDTIAQAGMIAAILDHDHKVAQCERIIKTRNIIKKKLAEIRFDVLESKSNFLFVKHKDIQAIDIYKYLRDNQILVRHFSKPERIENYLRISIGTDKQMNMMINKLSLFVNEMYNKSF
ncbi:MAG: histidinol-phosphate transaminase [Clostridiales bacterium]|nr:histidinol-phosphate transaminase [Clostridiales bacterium]